MPEDNPAQNELKVLITQAFGNRPVPVNAHTFIKKWDSASKPVAVKCDDGNEYVVKAHQPANALMKRVMVNEQIVAGLGRLIGASIPQTGFVSVPNELIVHQPEMAHLAPGIAHGSLYMTEITERLGFVNTALADNRPRFARFALLYGWALGSDHQFFY